MIEQLSDEAIAQKLHGVPGTKLKFESKLTDRDMLAFKDEMKIELRAIAQEAHNNCLKRMGWELQSLAKKITLKAGNKAGALFLAQTRDFRQELKSQVEGR